MHESISAGPCDVAGDMEIERLQTHLESRMKGRARNLRLLFRSKGLVLKGHASTYYVKQLAQHAVMSATTLQNVANEIEVR